MFTGGNSPASHLQDPDGAHADPREPPRSILPAGFTRLSSRAGQHSLDPPLEGRNHLQGLKKPFRHGDLRSLTFQRRVPTAGKKNGTLRTFHQHKSHLVNKRALYSQ